MKTLYLYNKNQFFRFKEQVLSEECEIYSISNFLMSEKVSTLDREKIYYVDVSSMVGHIRKNDEQILSFEQIFNWFGDNVKYICDKKYEKEVKYPLRHVFDEFVDLEIESDVDTVEEQSEVLIEKQDVRKIVDLNETELDDFFADFDARLYGHQRFKQEFKEIVKSFRVFNKLGEHKILSLFLMGDSGVGKTEVARSIHKALGSKTKIAKVNFGNYSSHDALNSLIGSPLGYIGSDGGELVKRMLESDVGLILIDEFEKADSAVFNYFLDVLENGKVVNSQAEEYDVSGYVIVFTSNISKTDFKNRISPELRSRFDYKGVFNLLTNDDKKKFVHFRVNQIIDKYRKYVSQELPGRIHEEIAGDIDVSKYKNMRDLNKRIKDLFVEKVTHEHLQ